MKLKKFRKNGKQKGIVIGCAVALLLTIAGINIYRTFALYKEEKTFNVLRGIVPDFSSGDVTLAFTVDGEKTNGESFPNKEDGYKVNDVSCDNEVTANWDVNNWGLINIQNPNGTTKIKCSVDFTTLPYNEQLNGADPVISGDLVAVKIDPNTGEVTKADTSKEWYNYKKKRWANAIIPTSEAKTTVKNYSAGTTISEDQIESYFVWIPKYKYKLFNLEEYESRTEKGNKDNQAIEIVFGTDNTENKTGECATPNKSGDIGDCELNDYMTHPAFLAFGGKGLWVGKFETGYKDATSSSTAEQGKADSTKVVIKPNQYSWRSINVSSAFTTAKGYQESLESHMMKNTEWGAVAYLTQSIYGRCTKGEDESTTCEEVTINNNSNNITGYALKDGQSGSEAASPGSDGTRRTVNYNNHNSVKASTTGNYTGIFDMSGGAYEYVMGVLYEKAGVKPLYSSSGFTDGNFPEESKYYDKYNYNSTSSNYKQRILGDATGEMGPFDSGVHGSYYTDYANFVYPDRPWFLRSGNYDNGTNAGVFYFSSNYGNAINGHGFRLVLAM